jgi:ribose 1,5-bisphosphokinase
VVEVTAPAELLAGRLATRGRGDDGDLLARLARSAELGPVEADATINNAGDPEQAGTEFTAFLRRHAEACGAVRARDHAEV